MDAHSTSVLEFDAIRKELTSYCLGVDGELLINQQDFFSDPDRIKAMQERSNHIRMLLEANVKIPAVTFPQILESLERAKKEGTVLEAEELANIALYLRSGERIAKYVSISLLTDVRSVLADEAQEMPDLRDLSSSLFAVVDEDGQIKESIPELRSIRRRMRTAQNGLQSAATTYLNRDSEIWQTDVPTLRDGRTVLPLKINYKGRIPGVVREVSQSGATIFVEPFDLVEKNNELAYLENEYAIEVARILRRCTQMIRESARSIAHMIDLAAYLDSIYARAQFNTRNKCTTADITAEAVALKSARHPLLGSSAVPIDMTINADTRVLIITGPNAGGKTVALKTVGLFVLMNQFGLGIPAEEGSSLPVYNDVFADIGDDQSIQQSLSTFSGHVTHIAQFIESNSPSTLVLLDELGSGTDPEEGSAIAMAILDYFLKRSSTVIVTTHHGVLKNYGYTQDGVMNASVAFDGETHKPTYRIILGLPGESHAFDIARSSGLSSDILNQARNYLDEQSTDIAHVIREISEKQRELNVKEEHYDRKRRDLLEKIRETDLRALKLKQHELELRNQGYAQMTKQLQESRKRLEGLVKELKEGELTREKTKSVKEFISNLEEMAEFERAEIVQEKSELLPEKELEPGVAVQVGVSKQRGTIIRRAKNNGWVIATENMKITVPEEDITPIQAEKVEVPHVQVSHISGAERPSYQLDLRGMRLNEALEAVDKQIDRALMVSLLEFEIIHGFGEGILQTGIHKYLRTHRAVRDFYFANPDSGGFGKTIVKLD